MNYRIPILAVAAFAAPSLNSQTAVGTLPPPQLTVCQVLSAARDYDGHMVTITGKVQGTDEGVWLSSEDCPGAYTVADHVWPSAIALVLPSLPAPLRLHPVDFEFDWNSRRVAEAKFKGLRKTIPESCMAFTYTGMFETRLDWDKARIPYANGTWRYAGFGHLGDAPARLVLRSEDNVSAMPNCDSKGRAPVGQAKK